MKIGIVSNSKICIPLLSYFSSLKIEVTLYFGKSTRSDINVQDLAGFCSHNRIGFHAEQEKHELYEWQQRDQPDFIFIAGYAHRLHLEALQVPSNQIFNIHFGSLPHYRGPSPVFWQLKNGDPQLGLAIHRLSQELDSGPIVWQHRIKNESHYTYSYVNEIFSQLQINGVAEIFQRLSNNQPLQEMAQDKSKAKFYKRPLLEDVMVIWETMTATEIIHLVKACTPWNNGASTLINGHELKIMDAMPTKSLKNAAPGSVNITDHNFTVSCIGDEDLAIHFFKIGDTYAPSRNAQFYGLRTGQRMSSHPEVSPTMK